MVTKKIGLAGKSGSGKDVVADYICEQYGYRKVAVADAIRDEVADFLFEIFDNTQDTHFQDGPHVDAIRDAFMQMVYEKPTPHAMRILLQWWGTEYRRSQDSDYWVKQLVAKMPEEDFVVVSDVRLPHRNGRHSCGGRRGLVCGAPRRRSGWHPEPSHRNRPGWSNVRQKNFER